MAADIISSSTAPVAPKKVALSADMLRKIDENAQGFEAMFMSQMLEFMWAGIETNDYFGGGTGEDTWHGMLIQEYGNVSAKAGNLGIADAVRAELIKMQEKMMPAAPVDGDTATPATEGETL